MNEEAHTPEADSVRPDEADIAAYLVAHPDFASRHPEAFEAQQISHDTPAAASLIERQVAVLRRTNRELAERFEGLVATARANERRVVELNRVARVMVGAEDVDTMLEALRTCLRDDLAVDRVYIGLTGAVPSQVRGINPLTDDSAADRALTNIFRRGKAVCGPLSASQAEALFATDDDALPTSAAFVPLGQTSVSGVIVLASADPQRFTEDMGTLFVSLFGELLTATLSRLLGPDVIA